LTRDSRFLDEPAGEPTEGEPVGTEGGHPIGVPIGRAASSGAEGPTGSNASEGVVGSRRFEPVPTGARESRGKTRC
jgi:hypothetical protein